MRQTFVTTLDNPYDYFTQFDEWYAFDAFKGYDTCGLVARIAATSPSMSTSERIRAINDAVDTIIRLNPTGNCRRAVKQGPDDVDDPDDDAADDADSVVDDDDNDDDGADDDD